MAASEAAGHRDQVLVLRAHVYGYNGTEGCGQVELGLHDIASLPASPCLSSRVETGLAIEPKLLDVIYRAEQLVRRALTPETVRCRIRRRAVVIELDAESIRVLDSTKATELRQRLGVLMVAAGVTHPVSFQTYRMGSAFLRPSDEQ